MRKNRTSLCQRKAKRGRGGGLRAGALFRRALALLLVFVTGWLLWLTADFGAAGRTLLSLADSAKAATALLDAELGRISADSLGDLTGMNRLVFGQSSFLEANLDPVQRWLAEQQTDASPAITAAPSPVPSDGPAESSAPSASPAGSSDPPAPTTTAPDSIVGRTMVPGSSEKYIHAGDLYLYNHTEYDLDLPQLLEDCPDLNLAQAEGPQVLIYHTHTTEAYTMDGTDIYQESDSSRTTDPDFNMIRVGEEIKTVLEAAGLTVIHDETLYDYPVYTDAYTRSLAGVEAILEQYPTIQLVLDVHRDALVGNDGTVYKTMAGVVEGSAQVMLVVGSDAGGLAHPDWRQNLSLALGIQQKTMEEYGTLIRPTVLRSSRFNQHLRPGSLLVEVGSHGNTLQEALTAARTFARSLAEVVA